MGAKRTAQGVSRGTIFVLAATMKQAEAWAEAHGLGKDKYRYVVNESVFDVMGPNDSYAYVAGLDTDTERHARLTSVVRARGLEWSGHDPYILVRDANGNVPRREAVDRDPAA